MNVQKVLSGSLGYFVVVYLLFLLLFVNWGGFNVVYPGDFFADARWNAVAAIAAGTLVWALSPVGVLVLALGAWQKRHNFFLTHKVAAVGEMVAMLIWVSVMSIALLAYADALFYHILNIHGLFLHWLLASGFLFGLLLMTQVTRRKNRAPQMTLWEKVREELSQLKVAKSEVNSERARTKSREDFSVHTDAAEGNYYTAYAHPEDYSYRRDNFKSRAKDRLKRNLKEFISDEIDRRF